LPSRAAIKQALSAFAWWILNTLLTSRWWALPLAKWAEVETRSKAVTTCILC